MLIFKIMNILHLVVHVTQHYSPEAQPVMLVSLGWSWWG